LIALINLTNNLQSLLGRMSKLNGLLIRTNEPRIPCLINGLSVGERTWWGGRQSFGPKFHDKCSAVEGKELGQAGRIIYDGLGRKRQR
jgi:hypothetical protein